MPRAICRCTAYQWPHRLGYGRCELSVDIFEPSAYCGMCGRLSNVINLEHGAISDCCRADIYLDAELTQPWTPFDDKNS